MLFPTVSFSVPRLIDSVYPNGAFPMLYLGFIEILLGLGGEKKNTKCVLLLSTKLPKESQRKPRIP
jgi:hypothetical protein